MFSTAVVAAVCCCYEWCLGFCVRVIHMFVCFAHTSESLHLKLLILVISNTNGWTQYHFAAAADLNTCHAE